VRAALPGVRAWVVGGAVRDALRGVASADVDLVVDGDAGAAAKALARATGGAPFALSDAFGAWRVVSADRTWQADLTPLRGGSLEADLALRDFTVDAIAEPLHGDGPRIDPHGGEADLRAGRLRPVGPAALTDDPLRVVRLARLATTMGLRADDDTLRAARAAAPGLDAVAGERVFAELNRMLTPAGIELLHTTGALARVLPEIDALRGVEQTVYHHKDAYGHTLEVLEHALDPAALLGPEHAATVAPVMAEPLADELTRGAALRWGALLHDSAKPQTQTPNPKGGFGFPGHQTLGADVAREVLTRLRASERLRAHAADLTRHHLRLGYLVHERPLTARTVLAYLRQTAPVAADVTLLTVCDRLATRGRKSEEAIAKHLDLAREVWPAVVAFHRDGPPRPLLRGDELGVAPGPEVGRLLAELQEAQYAGEVATRDEARAFLAGRTPQRTV
jgi:putative nucleotidyltransferase with HDIG domain